MNARVFHTALAITFSVPVLLAGVAGGSRTVAAQTAGRLTIVLGDMHLGAGGETAPGRWHVVEDFRWRDAWAAFLDAVDQAGNGATDLVVNGDMFELTGRLAGDCDHAEDPALGCTEPQALARLDRILAAHQTEVSALGAFAQRGANRVVIVPGDRDAALLFPSVGARLMSALNASDRVAIAAEGAWLSDDGAIYVEHGHQRRHDLFRFAGWPSPFVARGGSRHLERTFGEQLVQPFYDAHETRYPLVDNLAEDGLGVLWVAEQDADALASAGLDRLVRLALSKLSWPQFRLDLDGGAVEPPQWDLAAIRASGAAFFVDAFLPETPLHALAAAAQAEGRLTLDPGGLTDEQIAAVCDYRAALRRSRRRLERKLSQIPHVGPGIPECPRMADTRGTAFEFYWGFRDLVYTERLEAARGLRGTDAPPPKVLVYGHTHVPDPGFVPGRSGEWTGQTREGPLVISPGAWQRAVTPTHLRQLTSDKGWSDADVLRQLQPEALPDCYGVVWIDAYDADPVPRVRFWREDGRWGNAPRDAVGSEPCGGGGGGGAEE